MSPKNFVILVFGLVSWICCHTIWLFIGTQAYYIGTAIIIACSSYVINDMTAKIWWQKAITRLFLFISFNNLIDELLMNPEKIELNEYLLLPIYIIYTSWKSIKDFKTSVNG